MRNGVKIALTLVLVASVLGGEMIFLELPDTVQRRLKVRDHAFHSRITVLAAQNKYLIDQGEEPAGTFTYSHFKSLVETSSVSEMSTDSDVSQLKQMKCSCSFKKLFVNTIEKDFTDLMIGKIKPGRL